MQKRLKIAIIDSLGAHGSSHHYYLYGQVYGLSKLDLDVSLYTNNSTNNPNYKTVDFFQFYKNLFKSKYKIISGIRYIVGSLCSIIHARYKGVEICHYHIFHVNILVLFDFLLTKILGMKVVYTIHDVVSFEKNNSKSKLSAWIYRKVDKIITHNEFSLNIFLSHFKNIKSEVDIIPHGNYIKFIDVEKDQSFSRDIIGISDNKKVLLFFGMIKKVKGLDLLLKSLKHVIDHLSDVILVIAGKPWRYDFLIYKNIIKENGLENHCIIHDHFIPDEKVKYYYSAADLVVLPYREIYQSGVLLMSMSYQTPVLVSDLVPLTDVIKHLENGFIFKNGDVLSLSTQLNNILENTKDLSHIKNKAFKFIKNNYDWESIAIKTKKSYESIV